MRRWTRHISGIIAAAAVALVLMLGTIAYWARTGQTQGEVWCFEWKLNGSSGCVFVTESFGRTTLIADLSSLGKALPADIRSDGPTWSSALNRLATVPTFTDAMPAIERGFGVPLRSVSWCWVREPSIAAITGGARLGEPQITEFKSRNMAMLPSPFVWVSVQAADILPLDLHWVPFLLDWIVWTIPVWLFGAGLVQARRWNRRRRGRCAFCSYDLRGLSAGAVCPECGEAR